MPDENSLKDMIVLSGKEWDRINQQLYRRQLEQERIKAIREEKEARKALSKDMVKDWPNTLEVHKCYSDVLVCCEVDLSNVSHR